jgi:DNA-binding CsgD family transcriptional regulator
MTLFSAIGAEALAERTRRELVATGEKVRKRNPATHNELTPQEEQIARDARDGRSNAQIGAELFLSARTVKWHIRKVFMKLGSRLAQRPQGHLAFARRKRAHVGVGRLAMPARQKQQDDGRSGAARRRRRRTVEKPIRSTWASSSAAMNPIPATHVAAGSAGAPFAVSGHRELHTVQACERCS